MSENRNGKGFSTLQESIILASLILIAVPFALWMGLRDGRDLVKRADWKREVVVQAPVQKHEDSSPASSPEAIARGAGLFQTNCIACHGEKADGKGAAAVAFTPPPRNFTDPNEKWTHGRSPAQVFGTITGGVQGTGMAGFEASLTEAQRWDLVQFIRSLPGVQNVKD